MTTLLELVQTATDELGLPRQKALVSRDQPTPRQYLAIMNRVGRDLMRASDWSILTKVAEVTLADGTATYALPSDYDRWIYNTHWDHNNHWALIGPETPQRDRWRRESTISATGPRKTFRLIGGLLQFYPTPTASDVGHTITYEYVSRNWGLAAADSAGQSSFLADADTCVFPDDLMVFGFKWRWKAERGIDASAAKQEYDELLASIIGGDNKGELLNLGNQSDLGFVTIDNVPDGGYG